MVIEMLSKIRQGLSAAGWSLAGDGMLLRLRNASIALVGAVAAVGLGLTLFISQLGFPAVFSSPIPGGPTEGGSVHDAIALTQGPDAGSRSTSSDAPSAAIVPGRPRQTGQGGGTAAGGGGREGSRQIAVAPGAQSSPAASQPSAPVPVSGPTTQPAAPSPSVPSPAPAPAVTESPVQPSPGGQSKAASDGKAKPRGPSTAKATSDSSVKPGTPSTGKDQQVDKANRDTTSVAKSNGSPAEKASKDQSTAAAPKPVASAPPASPDPETASPAAAKEAADSGNSGGSRH
jgi:hypothetical protein